MPNNRTARDVWMAVRFPFVVAWFLLKMSRVALVIVGVLKPRPTVGDLRFPILMIHPDRRAPIVETSADGLRHNPLGASATDKVILIDSDFKVFAQSNIHSRRSDLVELWRIAVPSDRPTTYTFRLRRRSSGLKAARRLVLGCPAYREPIATNTHARDVMANDESLGEWIAAIEKSDGIGPVAIGD